jgi:O-antigen ligase
MATISLPAATTPRRASRHDLEGLQTRGLDWPLILVQSLLALSLLGAPLAFGAVQTWWWAVLALIAALTLTLWAVSSARRRLVELAWSPLFVPAGLFLLLATVRFLTVYPADSASGRNALLGLVTNLIFYFVAVQLAANATPESWRFRGPLVVAYTFGVSLFAIVQYFTSPTQLYWSLAPRWSSWVFGPYVNHNHYAGLMEMLIPLSAGYALSYQGPLRPLLAFGVLTPVASVLLSGSRGGMLALLLEAALLIAILVRKGRDYRRLIVTAVALAIFAAVVGFLWMDPGGLAKRLQSTFEPFHTSDVSFVQRRQVSLDSLRILRDHLWLGTGLGSFAVVYPKYQSIPTDAVWGHAHNDYVEVLSETGLVGGLLIGVAVLVWFRMAFGSLSDRLRHRLGWIQLGAALGCCGLLLHSLVDFNLHIPANAAWFAVCAALATPAPHRRRDSTQERD